MPDLSKLPAKSKVKLEVWSSRNLLRSSFHQKYPKLGPILQFIFAFFRDVVDELLLHCLHAHLKLSHLVHVSSAIKPAGVSLLEKQDSILFSKNPTKVQVAWCIHIRRSHIRIHTHTHLISHVDGIHCFHFLFCVTSVSLWPFIACHKLCIFKLGKKQRECLYSVKSKLRHRTKVEKNLAHSDFFKNNWKRKLDTPGWKLIQCNGNGKWESGSLS